MVSISVTKNIEKEKGTTKRIASEIARLIL